MEAEAEVDRWTDGEGGERVTKRILANAVGAELRLSTETVNNEAPARRDDHQ